MKAEISYDSVLWMIVKIPDSEVKNGVIRFIASKLGGDTGVDLNSPELLDYYDIHQGHFDIAADELNDDVPKYIVDVVEDIRAGDLYESCHSIIIE